MKEKNLLASVALFSELYNNSNYNNIFDIIGEFIKGAVLYDNKKNSYTATEIKLLLQNIYDFKILESVIKSTLNNKLKDEIERTVGYYDFTKFKISNKKDINAEFNIISGTQESIFNNLIAFIEKKERTVLNSDEKETVLLNFNHFLMDNGYSERYSDYISAFVVQNENNQEFKTNLNLIKEGLILYQGINFTSDLNELGKWNTDLTIYLNTEHLFNALGYNGILFKEIFDDFYNLVNEINNSAKNHNQKKRIELKYLGETKKEIDHFFWTAESIRNGSIKLDHSKSAMKNIIDTCSSLSEIKAKRIKFELDLKHKGIELQEVDISINELTKYNVEDSSVIELLTKQSEENGKVFNEYQSQEYFQIFSKLNCLRKGESNRPFERIGYILMTENSFVKFLSHNNAVKFGDFDTPFAKDIEFITTKFWFKLKKGFSDKQSLPKSFDVSTKARIILSAHLANSISDGYQKLTKELDAGTLTKEEAYERSYEFREKLNKPEEITRENIDSALDFLKNETYFEDLNREKARKEILLKDTQAENERLAAELRKRDMEVEDRKQHANNLAVKKKQDEYVETKWLEEKSTNWKDLRLLMLVIGLNLFVALTPLLIGINNEYKKWFCEFGILQILTIALIVIVIIIEIIGRSYLFNKDRIKNGWFWLSMLFNSYKKDDLEELKKKEFKEAFINSIQ